MTRRVLHAVESLEPQAGSVAISLTGLFRALARREIESEAITEDGPGIPAGGDPAGVEKLLGDVDAVHIHGWRSEFARAVARAARTARKPYVISPLGGLSEGPYHEQRWRDRLRDTFGGKTLVRRAAAVSALNEWELRDLQSRNLNARVMLLPYGLNVDEYESCDASAGERTGYPAALGERCLLMLGPIHPVEGLVPLLKAFAEIMSEAQGWSIVIAGPERGDWHKMIGAAMRRKGADDRVRLANAPDQACQQAWLARADILASPALHVRCPVSIMQAVAAGVNVIASDRVVPVGLSGAITTCGLSRAELKDALRSIIQLPEGERITAAQEAKVVGRSVFDWSVLADNYVRVYESLS